MNDPDHLAIARILLAEDDDEMRRMIAEDLRRDGYDVVECRNGIEFLRRLDALLLHGDEVGVDLIISDVRMPGLTGLEILELLRAQDPFTPMIIVSAFGDRHTQDEATGLGASCFLEKPFDVALLRSIVRASIARPQGVSARQRVR